MRYTRLLLPLVTFCSHLALAQATPSLPLRQSQLDAAAASTAARMVLDSTSDARWLGGGATVPRWSLDGEWFYFQFALNPKPLLPGTPADDPWWRVSRDGKRVEAVDRAAAQLIPTGVQYTRDLSRAVYFHRNELHYWRRGSGSRVLLGRDVPVAPRWTPDERSVQWTESNSVFQLDPESGSLRQLTKAVVQTEVPRPDKGKDLLKADQKAIFDFVKQQIAARDSNTKLAMTSGPWKPITTPFEANDNLSFLSVSPKGDYVTYLVTPRAQDEQTHFGEYVNETGIVVDRTSRPKVGTPPPGTRAAIVPANPALHPDSVKITWVDTAGFGKSVIPTQLQWNDQYTHLLAEFQSVDFKDRWITLIDPATGKRTKELWHEHDDAWFGGPSPITGWLSATQVYWLPDGETIALVSEISGWAHLYLVSMDGARQQLTRGDWEIRTLALSNNREKWWIHAGVEHPNELHLYELPLRGGTFRRVDQLGEGEITSVLSPDEQTLALRWASPMALPDIYVTSVSASGQPTRVTRAGTDAFYKVAWIKSDFVQFNDDKGNPVFARVYRPRTPHANRPAVMEIHGAGYAQGVHKSFGGAGAHGGRLYAQYLAERGITYVVLDYRGSAGYGRNMRTDIYRSMGDRDVNSAIAAIPFLQKNYNVNPNRIGLFGCSYGGFFTLMALFKHPGTFQAGAAQCSVTDWAHYNHGYTARILNGSPVEDTTAYRVSSPIWHAAGLKDRLLLQHGLVDNNVEYQDAVRLVQRMMELGKDFEFVTYPIEAHGWGTRWSQIDSNRRVTKLWEETILARK